MRTPLPRAALLLVTLTALLPVTNIARAQGYPQRLRSPAITRGLIGGESHNSYVIRARKGQIMTVHISWRPERTESGDNQAEFFVGTLPNFDGGGQVQFGKESQKGKRWSGRIPRTGDYYIYVNAYPTAHYTLRVTVR